jgi:hypothetical protein
MRTYTNIHTHTNTNTHWTYHTASIFIHTICVTLANTPTAQPMFTSLQPERATRLVSRTNRSAPLETRVQQGDTWLGSGVRGSVAPSGWSFLFLLIIAIFSNFLLLNSFYSTFLSLTIHISPFSPPPPKSSFLLNLLFLLPHISPPTRLISRLTQLCSQGLKAFDTRV